VVLFVDEGNSRRARVIQRNHDASLRRFCEGSFRFVQHRRAQFPAIPF
jgi:hypothetical protein